MCCDWMPRVVELFLQLLTIKLLGFSDAFKLQASLCFSLCLQFCVVQYLADLRLLDGMNICVCSCKKVTYILFLFW